MSAEALRKGQIDIDSEISGFVVDKLKALDAERKKRQEAEESLHLRVERDDQERRAILAAGNDRTEKIIQESGIREILEQTRLVLARYYPSSTLAERELVLEKGGGLHDNSVTQYVDYSKKEHQFRLGWKPVPENTRIKIWDPRNLGDGQEFYYLDVTCSGWGQIKTWGSHTIENMYFEKVEIPNVSLSYERRDSLIIFCGLPGGIKFLNDEWRDSEKLKQAIAEAIKNPWVEKVPYVMHDRIIPSSEHYR